MSAGAAASRRNTRLGVPPRHEEILALSHSRTSRTATLGAAPRCFSLITRGSGLITHHGQTQPTSFRAFVGRLLVMKILDCRLKLFALCTLCCPVRRAVRPHDRVLHCLSDRRSALRVISRYTARANLVFVVSNGRQPQQTYRFVGDALRRLTNITNSSKSDGPGKESLGQSCRC